MNSENTNNNDYNDFHADIVGNENDLAHECINLLHTSGYDDTQKEEIERELWHYHEEELQEMKANLLMNQLDPIEQGQGYTQKDIKRKLS